jgi:PAS domain S-box-containing protein
VTEAPSILLVDDNAAKRIALKAILEPLCHPIVEADSGLAALRSVMAQDFAVILLDICMPTMDGFETAAFIRQRQQSEMTPIIFITAFDDEEIRHRDHYSEGAVDFISSPVDPVELRAKVSVFVKLFIKATRLATHAHEVQTSADQLRLLTDAAPIGIFQTNATDHYVYTNPRWSQITSIAAEDAAGQHWRFFMDGDDHYYPEVELFEGSRHFEITFPDAISRTVLLTAASIPSTRGGRTGSVGTLADVTAEVKAEVAASHFRAVVESSHDAIISRDLDGVITSWNTGAQRLYGYSPAEAIGQPLSMLAPPEGGHDASELPRRVNVGEQVVDLETLRQRKDGSLVDVSLTTSPILGAAGVVVGASIIARDISDRRRTEQLKDEFLALVSHELRTPLSSIVAYIELLLDEELKDSNLRRQFMEIIDRNSIRLERLVGDLLFVAQLESANLSLSMEEVDIVAVATESVEAATPRAQQVHIALMLAACEGPLMLTGDPGRLGQAIDNLISNAIKYSPEGGDIEIRVARVGDGCVIDITDNGVGIATEEQTHLFDRFFRGTQAADLHIQGVGLGLSIVKRIIEGHGGRVDVVSTPGAGATFRLSIPLSQRGPRPSSVGLATTDHTAVM